MPPEITAGLPALAGSPPGAAAGLKPAEPPTAGPLNAALFASVLAQSSLPAPTPTFLQAPAEQAAGAVFTSQPPAPAAAKKAASKAGVSAAESRLALKPWKTMDTLPKISVPQQEPKASASGLLLTNKPVLPNEPAHKAPAKASLPDAPVCTASVLGAALIPAVPVGQPQPAPFLPLVQSVAPPSQAPVSLAGAVPAASAFAAPLPAPPAMPPKTSFEAAPVKQLVPLQSTLSAGLTPLAAPDSVPAEAMPQVRQTAQTAGAAAPPARDAAVPAARLSALPPASAAVALPAARSFQSQEPAAMPPLAWQQAASLQRQPLVPAPAFAGSHALPDVAASLSSQSAALVPAPPAPASAKSAGKSVTAALKPAEGNADTYTRTLSGETAVAADKTPTAPARPVPSFGKQHATPETLEPAKSLDTKKTAEQAAPLELIGSVPETQAPGGVVKPLSAADHISAADHAAMVRQVAEGVGAMPLPVRPGAAQQMSLQLHPKDWGSLQVSVSVVPGPEANLAKTVTAHIVAETPQVKAALQSQSGALHQALRASGLNLEHLTVSVKPPAEANKAASPSASAGFSSGQEQAGQGQPGGGSQPQNNPQAGSPSGTASFGSASAGTTFGSGSQDPRQGQFSPAFASPAAPAEPDGDDMTIERLPMRPVSGRIDTLA